MNFLETLWQDLRYGFRLLRLNPAFAAVAILSLALGIGANTAIFELLNAVRLRTLPVKDPQELAEIRIENREWAQGRFSGRYPRLSYPLWEQIRDHQQAFSGVFAFGPDTFNLATGGQAHYAQAMWVSGDAFRVLAVPALLGRVFNAEEDKAGCAPTAVLGYSFWQRQYGGDAGVVGRTLTLEGHPFQIVGVTPASFYGVEVGRNYDVAVPLCTEPIIRGEDTQLQKRDSWWLVTLGRLQPGMSLAQATAQLKVLSPGFLEATLPEKYDADAVKHYREYRLVAVPAAAGLSGLRSDYESPLWILLAIAALVLLIACANLANLMLARATAREREISIRLAMGALRRRLIRQMLAESLLLAVVGAIVGALLARAVSRFLVSFLSTETSPLFVDLSPDWRIFAFTAALAVGTTVLFGLIPALRATKADPAAAIKATGRGLTTSRERFSLRRILVVSQVAMSLVLVIGALLFIRSLNKLLTLDAGFQQNGILITDVDLTRLNLPKERRQGFKQDMLRRIAADPRVESAADTTIVPLRGDSWNQVILVNDKPVGDNRKSDSKLTRVSPGYFRTMGTPLLSGRDFGEQDTSTSPKVAIINQKFANTFFAGSDPRGKTFRLRMGQGETSHVYQVIGVVKDTKYEDLRADITPIAYFPMSQDDRPDQYDEILIRSQAPLPDVVQAVKRIIGETHPEITISFHVFKTEVRDRLLRERLMAMLSGVFGLLAGLLAVIGVYGVISYMVARRTNEIGIRMALGARPGSIARMVLGEAATLLGAGIVIGACVAVIAARAAQALLFGLKPGDPLTLAAAIAGLAAVALAASYLPARRAARLDPMIALRDE